VTERPSKCRPVMFWWILTTVTTHAMCAPYYTENFWVEGEVGAVKGVLHPDGRKVRRCTFTPGRPQADPRLTPG